MVQTDVTAAADISAGSGFRRCRVAEVRPDGEGAVITIEPPAGEDWSFVHGQHLVFRRELEGTELRRSYSLCSPAPDGPLRVAVRLVPGGAFSSWVCTELVAGDEVEVLPPSGRFTHELDPEAARTYLLVAGGSGITPILSIAATVLAAEPRSEVTLFYLNRTTASTMLLDEVDGLRNRHLGRLHLWYAFTREPTAIDLLDGRPDAARVGEMIERGILPSPSNIDQAFLCGPEGLLEAFAEGLTAAGVDPSVIHTERFSAGAGRAPRSAPRAVAATARPVAEATVTLHGRTTTVPVHAGDTVLEAAQRARPEVPYSCRAGVCSTCRAHLDHGEVTMEVCHGLEPPEVAAGYVLTCQAVPTSATVVVDYDV